MIKEIRYSQTNTYFLKGEGKGLLFDTGWAGTFPAFLRALGEEKIDLKGIGALMISHFHPDHYGIAQNIADHGIKILVFETQYDFLHQSDPVFEKEKRKDFLPIREEAVKRVRLSESRQVLASLGLSGEVFSTPGHSDDSISLWLDKEKALFVGDLNPLYELELHKGTKIEESWNRLLSLSPKTVYYGHAKTAVLSGSSLFSKEKNRNEDVYALVKRIMKYLAKGASLETIQKKTGADPVFIEDVAKMVFTHQNITVQGVLDRIEIKGR